MTGENNNKSNTIKRIDLSSLNTDKNDLSENANLAPCKCCTQVLKFFEDEISKLTNTVNELQKTLATQKVLTEQLIRQEKHNEAMKIKFPLKDALEKEICEENRQNYVKTMKTLLKGKLTKTLTSVLSEDVFLDINIDGTHGKQRFKNFNNVYDSIMDAVRPYYDDPVKELRKAIKTIKNRHFHKVCVDNKKPK